MSSNNNNKKDEQILSDFLFNISGKMKDFETDNSKNIKRFKKHAGRVVEDISDFIEDKTEKVKSSYEKATSENSSESNGKDDFPNPLKNFDLFGKIDEMFAQGNKGEEKVSVEDYFPDTAQKNSTQKDSSSKDDYLPGFSGIFGSSSNSSSSSSTSQLQDMFQNLINVVTEERNVGDDDSTVSSDTTAVKESSVKIEEKTENNKTENNSSSSVAEKVYKHLNRKMFQNEQPNVILDDKDLAIAGNIAKLARKDGAVVVNVSTDDNVIEADKQYLDELIAETGSKLTVVLTDATSGSVRDLEYLVGDLVKNNDNRFIYTVISAKNDDSVKKFANILS